MSDGMLNIESPIVLQASQSGIAIGPRGIQGIQGIQGLAIQGVQGLLGVQGPLGIQGIQIATGSREQINWSQVGGAAVGGFVFGGMGLLTPGFTVSSTSFMKNLPTYLGKAGWAGLTGIASSGTGMLATDLFEGDGINYSAKDYLKTMGTAGAFSFGLSFAGSMYDYASWDRFSNTQKVDILKRKFFLPLQFT